MLRDIEWAAGERFRDIGMDNVADDEPPPAAQLAEAARRGHLWVAEVDLGTGGGPVAVGYAWGVLVGDQHHLEQVSVVPEATGRGVGRALIEHVAAWARSEGGATLTLSTFRDVGWNGPLYAHLGFEEVPEPDADPRWRHLRHEESAAGLDPAARIIMRLPLT